MLNDNDFSLQNGAVPGDGTAALATEFTEPVLGIVRFDLSNGLDPSDRDGQIAIDHWPVWGMYMPDGMASYETDGMTYFVTGNEGDSRDYDEDRIRGGVDEGLIDASALPAGADDNALLGRLKYSVLDGDLDGGGIDQVHVYGARSFSIWDGRGNLVWDSGDFFEQITARAYPFDFNSTNDENFSFDSRSDDKGPEPEGVAIGEIDGKFYAFIGLERIGGVMIFDVSEPSSPVFVDYVNGRNFIGDPEYGVAGDLGPEGLEFVPEAESPTGTPLLLVGNEVSGTTSVFQVNL